MVERLITLYRPVRLERVVNGVPAFSTGDLRARIWFFRVPVLWAVDKLYRTGYWSSKW